MKIHNFINVGPECESTFLGTLPPTTVADLDRMMTEWTATPPEKIVLYVHGGLVSCKSGIEGSKELINTFDTPNTVFLSLLWHTDFLTALQENLGMVIQTDFFEALLKIVIRIASRKIGALIGAKSATGGEISYAEIEAELTKAKTIPYYQPFAEANLTTGAKNAVVQVNDIDNETYMEKKLKSEAEIEINTNKFLRDALLKVEVEKLPLLKTEEVVTAETEGSKGIISAAKIALAIGKIAYRVLKRFHEKRDHGLHCTVVEEIGRHLYLDQLGTSIWTGMKDKAAALWHPTKMHVGDPNKIGRQFLTRLQDFKSQHPDVSLHFIGHSAGAIVGCELLKHTHDLTFDNLFFLAPACRADLFADEVIAHPERFGHFRMFTMRDEKEQLDRLIDMPVLEFLYTHSLLYLVSGLFEPDGTDSVILGMERFWGQNPPLPNDSLTQKLQQFLEGKVILADVFGMPEGENCGSLDHGAFDNDSSTVASLKFLINR
ncbi:hypothetical protein GVN20_09365 [Runella sp. CRIBMP]|uniref:hypothetical protein n=1 Tax=Runella sp. CRIBMP TaxID=2683261 RepID=UPI001411E40B|nr:hypothetical protein [Runella sp. CRIBMP]NBB19557.1 hypothetical protein [Runella sp. CRIBMP]